MRSIGRPFLAIHGEGEKPTKAKNTWENLHKGARATHQLGWTWLEPFWHQDPSDSRRQGRGRRSANWGYPTQGSASRHPGRRASCNEDREEEAGVRRTKQATSAKSTPLRRGTAREHALVVNHSPMELMTCTAIEKCSSGLDLRLAPAFCPMCCVCVCVCVPVLCAVCCAVFPWLPSVLLLRVGNREHRMLAIVFRFFDLCSAWHGSLHSDC